MSILLIIITEKLFISPFIARVNTAYSIKTQQELSIQIMEFYICGASYNYYNIFIQEYRCEVQPRSYGSSFLLREKFREACDNYTLLNTRCNRVCFEIFAKFQCSLSEFLEYSVRKADDINYGRLRENI